MTEVANVVDRIVQEAQAPRHITCPYCTAVYNEWEFKEICSPIYGVTDDVRWCAYCSQPVQHRKQEPTK